MDNHPYPKCEPWNKVQRRFFDPKREFILKLELLSGHSLVLEMNQHPTCLVRSVQTILQSQAWPWSVSLAAPKRE